MLSTRARRLAVYLMLALLAGWKTRQHRQEARAARAAEQTALRAE